VDSGTADARFFGSVFSVLYKFGLQTEQTDLCAAQKQTELFGFRFGFSSVV
jgi:hypothetical protein